MEQETTAEEVKPKRKKRHQQLKRNFIGHDADFFVKNRVIRTVFMQALASFTAIDPTLDNAFADGWLLNIEDCEGRTTDETMCDLLAEKTSELHAAAATALRLTTDLEFYVKKAFPDDPALWDEFAFGKRNTVSQSTPHLVIWLFTMLKVINDYETELLAAGMSVNFKTDFDNAIAAVAEAELEQEYTKRLRLRLTRQRIAGLNRLHGYLLRVQKAGDVLYYDDEVMRKQLD